MTNIKIKTMWATSAGIIKNQLTYPMKKFQTSPMTGMAALGIFDETIFMRIWWWQASGTSLSNYLVRCMQPAQQQGRRFPSISSARVLSTCFLLVSGFLFDITQQIHSLRASGVISFHAVLAAGVEVIAFRKSDGILCIKGVLKSFGEKTDSQYSQKIKYEWYGYKNGCFHLWKSHHCKTHLVRQGRCDE